MKLLNFNIIKITLSLILGIFIANKFSIDFYATFFATLILFVAVGIYWLSIKNKIHKQPYFGILIYLCFVGVGINVYNIKTEKLHKNHYTNFNLDRQQHQFELKIIERLKPDIYNDKYVAELSKIDNNIVKGKLLINISKDSTLKPLSIDDKLVVISHFNTIQKPLNPHQFDYRKYLELKQVYHQLYLKTEEITIINTSKKSIYGLADRFRSIINNNLKKAGFNDEVLSIINALLLGQRQSIDKSIYNNYVNSGTIHILAVSGLHVGILLWLLNFFFKPLLFLKNGRILRPFVIVLLLWSFAIVAGLSPSVTRAVTMFSIISIAMHLKRPTNIYNTLFISAFVILLVKPRFLFEVGFQLSYLAVFGIVSIQPLVYKSWKPKLFLIDKLWQIFTVTLAAQIGVVPISLYYFHQFPGLFFISNLVVIPFLSIILGLGLLVIILAFLNWLTPFVVTAYSFIIESLNDFIAWIAQFEAFLLRDIPFTLAQAIVTYLIIFGLLNVFKKRKTNWLVFSFISIIAFQFVLVLNKYKSQNSEFVVFNKSRYSLIGQKRNNQLLLHHNLSPTKRASDNTISNYKVGEKLTLIAEDSIQSLYNFNNTKILVIDSIGIYKNLSFKPELVLLRDSPKINLSRLIDSLQPEMIIADASNYKSYAIRWKETCQYKKIPFHYTNEKGAFILK
ncbi:ComEC/Rec2 family competence protein [Winogradskyella alexanderae]|uniref:Competence protein ComEC family protein n=1 Tax=Winogradskyella alexanderae TaxID=2877123 RepID=A0ABS7XR44_9FLAO|nr:ComEC/Rec2 family competence protein [Winogradskyella alexanderae]MCA0132478.1 competence protein ComEC family protein [Winogradskyella alexanderae]